MPEPQETSGVPPTRISGIPCGVLALTSDSHQCQCSQGPCARYVSKCAPSTPSSQCSAGHAKLCESTARAVPKTGPENGPKTVPQDGSTDSGWNHSGGQIWGSIGGSFLSTDPVVAKKSHQDRCAHITPRPTPSHHTPSILPTTTPIPPPIA